MLIHPIHPKTHVSLLSLRPQIVTLTLTSALSDTETRLQSHTWRYNKIILTTKCCTCIWSYRGKKVRVFLCGDFYVDYMGFQVHQVCSKPYTTNACTHTKLQLPLGRHCCLWCLIQSSQLKQPPSTRGPVLPRSTDSICRDYDGFVRAGNDIKQAKFHNNVIQEPFFKSLPLSQVRLYTYMLKHHNVSSLLV